MAPGAARGSGRSGDPPRGRPPVDERATPRLVPVGDIFREELPMFLFRFLLDDGRTVDVVAHYDDSILRDLVLQSTGAERIEGVAKLPVPLPVDAALDPSVSDPAAETGGSIR